LFRCCADSEDDPPPNDFFLARKVLGFPAAYGQRNRADRVDSLLRVAACLLEIKASTIVGRRPLGTISYDTATTLCRSHKSSRKQRCCIILSTRNPRSYTKEPNRAAETDPHGWEHFARVEGNQRFGRAEKETKKAIVSLDTSPGVGCGVGEPSRLLDWWRTNSLSYSEGREAETAKIIAKNSITSPLIQWREPNKAIEATSEKKKKIKDNPGASCGRVLAHRRVPARWTKIFSMVFFSQKVLRKLQATGPFYHHGCEDLAWQIYRNFASQDAVLEDEKSVRAQSAENLKTLLIFGRSPYLYIVREIPQKRERHTQSSRTGPTSSLARIEHTGVNTHQFAVNRRNALRMTNAVHSDVPPGRRPYGPCEKSDEEGLR